MKALLQKVLQASVVVKGSQVGEIGEGLLVYVGLEKNDTRALAERMVERLLSYRVFLDDEGKMNLSVRQKGRQILAVSQFTLAADTRKGNRAGFSTAMHPEAARELFSHFLNTLESRAKPEGVRVASGQFQAHMQVSSVNNGPINFLLSL